MNILRIFHETIYQYHHPVHFGPHRLVLRPREGHDIQVEEMRLEIEPKHVLHWSRDVFGNSVATVHFLEPHRTLIVRNHVLIRQTAPFPSPAIPADQCSAFPVVYSELEQMAVAAYQSSVFPEDVAAVRAWAANAIDFGGCADAEAVVKAFNRKVHECVKYKRREMKGVQSPSETLLLGTGSCRDLATLLLEALRTLGFPTRFASGYRHCLASEAGHASTHAWTEVYLPEIGWTGYDPTVGDQTSEKHVVTGVSNHPLGVMPVVGSFYGYRREFISMNVRVQTESLA